MSPPWDVWVDLTLVVRLSGRTRKHLLGTEQQIAINYIHSPQYCRVLSVSCWVFLNKKHTHNIMSSYQDVRLSVRPSVRKCSDKCGKEGTSVSYCHIFESFVMKKSFLCLVDQGLHMLIFVDQYMNINKMNCFELFECLYYTILRLSQI